jgi:hypothetical protein
MQKRNLPWYQNTLSTLNLQIAKVFTAEDILKWFSTRPVMASFPELLSPEVRVNAMLSSDVLFQPS